MAFHVIGVGPGDSELLTMKAVRLIGEADVIIVPVKKEGSQVSTALDIARPYVPNIDKVEYYYFPMFHNFAKDPKTMDLFKSHADSINNLIDEDKSVVFLTLGDPSIYCTYTYIDKYVKEVNHVPGIPSFINGAALVSKSLCIGDESLCILNMTDSHEDIKKKFDLHESIVVMKVCVNQELLKTLIVEGNRDVTFLSNIGMENEHVTSDINILDNKMPYFTIAIIR